MRAWTWLVTRIDGPRPPEARRRRRYVAAGLSAVIGVGAGVAAIGWLDQPGRGADGGVAIDSHGPPTTPTTRAPAGSTTTSAPTTAAAPVGSTVPGSAGRVGGPGRASLNPPVTSPPTDPPALPSMTLSQAQDCVQASDSNHLVATVRAPAGISSVSMVAVHTQDGTIYAGTITGDQGRYTADLGPFSPYPTVETVTWTVTVTDAIGRSAQAVKDFAVSGDPCP